MSDLLSNGTSGLLAFQRALTTTSQNIANVNTEGYARQRVNLEAANSNSHLRHEPGSGVRLTGIQRLQDQFATAELRRTSSLQAQQSVHHELASRIDSMMADDGLSVTPALNEFFGAIQDANADPSSPSGREVVLQKAREISGRFGDLQTQLDGLQAEVNDRLRAGIDELNELAASLADLNKRIVSGTAKLQGQSPNALLDQRDHLLESVSNLLDVRTVEQEDGAVNVFAGNGLALVLGSDAQSLRSKPDPDFPDRLQLEIGGEPRWRALGPELGGGRLGGLRDFEGSTLASARNQLGRLSIVLADELNAQHASGKDLSGQLGGALFERAEPLVASSRDNTGTGTVGATISDSGALQSSDYRLRYDGVEFEITRLSDGEQFNGSLPLSIDGLELSLTGSPAVGDEFIVSPTARAAASLRSVIDRPGELALASPLASRSALDNSGDSSIGAATALDSAAAGFADPVELVFTAPDQLDAVHRDTGAVIASGIAYQSGEPITLNGWEVRISGPGVSGDRHYVEADAGGIGSNGNGLALAELQSRNVLGGTGTLNDTYANLVSEVGGQTRTLETRTRALDALHADAMARQQSTQGVNLDEEAVNLTRYQQAYQASAQVIATADSLFQTLIGVVAR